MIESLFTSLVVYGMIYLPYREIIQFHPPFHAIALAILNNATTYWVTQ